MRETLKKLKTIGSLALGGLLTLLFAGEAKALDQPLYGLRTIIPPPIVVVPVPATPKDILSKLYVIIGGALVVFVIMPIVGMLWYYKRGGKKKWPSIVGKILIGLFLLALVALAGALLSHSPTERGDLLRRMIYR